MKKNLFEILPKTEKLVRHLSCHLCRMSVVMLFFALNFGYVRAQTQKLSVHIIDKPLENVLSVIQKETNLDFFYNNSHIDVHRRVSISADNETLDRVLKELFAGTNVTYLIKDTQIILSNEKSTNTNQKEITVEGLVTDRSGVPIIGASVVEKGKSNGTVTDVNGHFTLRLSSLKTKLEVSYIGYRKKEVQPAADQPLNIVLDEDTKLLDEVVVVGYGSMKKQDLTGAVSSVKMKDTPVGTVTTISHALAGKAAGLQVSTISAQPGGATSFRIRGAASVKAGNDPLIIIDGFPVTNVQEIAGGKYSSGSSDNILASLNPNDIESIEVLKDASSTAIYGARAGNGVIIITTKKGKSGAAKVSYSGTYGVQNVAKEYDMLDAHSFMLESNRYAKEVWRKNNGVGIYGGKSETSVSTPYKPYYSDQEIFHPENDTDWFSDITRSGYQTQHNLSVMGGTEYTKYMISGNFLRQNGVVKNNDIQRYTGRINLEQKVGKYFNLGVNLTLSRNMMHNIPLGAGQNENASIMVAAAQFNPLLPVRDKAGEYVLNSQAAFLPNPVSLLEISDKSVKERLLSTAFIEYTPIKELVVKANFGIDRNYQKRSVYMPKTTLYGKKAAGKADINQYDKSDYLFELTANFNKQMGNHHLNALVGYSFQRFTDESLGAGNSIFLTDGFLYNNLNAGSFPKPTVNSSASKNEMASFFARVNYTLYDRYLLTATLRADGASNFAENYKWGYFPSVALGWRFTEEKFLYKLKKYLSNGKLRISYGETGNSNIGNRAISYYKTGNNYVFNNTAYTGVYMAQVGNPKLKWETTREWNFGLDLGFFNNRLNVTAEYFHRIVSDLLSEQALNSFQEVHTIAANIGKTQSQGVELTVNSTNIATKNWKWNTDFTFSFYRDKWNERDANWKPNAYDEYNAPLRYYAGYLSDGLVKPGEKIAWMPGALPGQVKIKDVNGYIYDKEGKVKVDKYGIPLKSGKPDGKLDDADKVIYGSSDPGYLVGLNNTIVFKNWDLNIYLYGQLDLLNMGSYKDLWLTGASGMTGVNNIYRGYNMPTSISDIYSSDYPTGNRPSYFQGDSTWGIGDYYMKKSWFVRCRNITLGYTLPANKYLSRVRIYADINNPFMLTPYKGLDLETDNNVWAYPNIRSYTLGVDITF